MNECPPGNLVAGMGCKWDLGFHEITTVEFGAYRVPGSDACYAGFEFSPYDYQSDMVGAPTFSGRLRLGRMRALGDVVLIRGSGMRHSGDFSTWMGRGRVDFAQEGNRGLIVLIGHPYRIGSPIPPGIPSDVYTYGDLGDLPSYYIQLTVTNHRDIISQRAGSPWLPIPAEVNEFSMLVFECVDDIRREKEHQSMQEEMRAKKAAEERAAEKARADAEAKAELQRIELEAAKEIQRKAFETELFKTQALLVQLERGKAHHRRLEQGSGNPTCWRTRSGEDYQHFHGRSRGQQSRIRCVSPGQGGRTSAAPRDQRCSSHRHRST